MNNDMHQNTLQLVTSSQLPLRVSALKQGELSLMVEEPTITHMYILANAHEEVLEATWNLLKLTRIINFELIRGLGFKKVSAKSFKFSLPIEVAYTCLDKNIEAHPRIVESLHSYVKAAISTYFDSSLEETMPDLTLVRIGVGSPVE